jgi:hypothetical protein
MAILESYASVKARVQADVRRDKEQMQAELFRATALDPLAYQTALANVEYYQREALRLANENNALKGEIARLKQGRPASALVKYNAARQRLTALGIKPSDKKGKTFYDLLEGRGLVWVNGEWQ